MEYRNVSSSPPSPFFRLIKIHYLIPTLSQLTSRECNMHSHNHWLTRSSTHRSLATRSTLCNNLSSSSTLTQTRQSKRLTSPIYFRRCLPHSLKILCLLRPLFPKTEITSSRKWDNNSTRSLWSSLPSRTSCRRSTKTRGRHKIWFFKS